MSKGKMSKRETETGLDTQWLDMTKWLMSSRRHKTRNMSRIDAIKRECLRLKIGWVESSLSRGLQLVRCCGIIRAMATTDSVRNLLVRGINNLSDNLRYEIDSNPVIELIYGYETILTEMRKHTQAGDNLSIRTWVYRLDQMRDEFIQSNTQDKIR